MTTPVPWSRKNDVRQPVMGDGGDAGIAHQHFVDAARRRVALEGREQVAVQ